VLLKGYLEKNTQGHAFKSCVVIWQQGRLYSRLLGAKTEISNHVLAFYRPIWSEHWRHLALHFFTCSFIAYRNFVQTGLSFKMTVSDLLGHSPTASLFECIFVRPTADVQQLTKSHLTCCLVVVVVVVVFFFQYNQSWTSLPSIVELKIGFLYKMLDSLEITVL